MDHDSATIRSRCDEPGPARPFWWPFGPLTTAFGPAAARRSGVARTSRGRGESYRLTYEKKGFQAGSRARASKMKLGLRNVSPLLPLTTEIDRVIQASLIGFRLPSGGTRPREWLNRDKERPGTHHATRKSVSIMSGRPATRLSSTATFFVHYIASGPRQDPWSSHIYPPVAFLYRPV